LVSEESFGKLKVKRKKKKEGKSKLNIDEEPMTD
jgi:hypothetical protein